MLNNKILNCVELCRLLDINPHVFKKYPCIYGILEPIGQVISKQDVIPFEGGLFPIPNLTPFEFELTIKYRSGLSIFEKRDGRIAMFDVYNNIDNKMSSSFDNVKTFLPQFNLLCDNMIYNFKNGDICSFNYHLESIIPFERAKTPNDHNIKKLIINIKYDFYSIKPLNN